MSDIFVGRLMSSPVHTVTLGTSLEAAAATMRDNGIGSVVVVDDAGILQGILTATDFVRLAADGESASEMIVDSYMTTEVITTTANESIRDVADTMLEHQFHHVPVADEQEGLIGMLTTTDLTAYLSHVDTPNVS